MSETTADAPKKEASKNVLFVAMPSRGRSCLYDAAIAHYHASLDPTKFGRIIRAKVESSLLTYGFNRMWAAAHTLRESEGVTHFAMIHDDIACAPGWADVLLAELEANDADIVSAVVPIKDERGITSVGWETGDTFSPKRLTTKEIHERPETFTDPKILLNTGLWVCDLRKPWAAKVCFRQQDQIVVQGDGRFVARTNPEDWDFSRQAKALGAVLYATRKVVLWHERPEFRNDKVWGKWETDEGDPAKDPRVKKTPDIRPQEDPASEPEREAAVR